MTVVTFASVKGAPGVTTTACLVGASWPSARRAVVAECDPGGGDLAARFVLSSVCGWPTFTTAARREGTTVSVVPHLQQLPGGLEVLVGTHPSGEPGPGCSPSALLAAAALEHDPAVLDHDHAALDHDPTGERAVHDGVIDLLVDVGRLHPTTDRSGSWLDHADIVALVLGTDAASVLHVHGQADRLRHRCGDRIVLILITDGAHRAAEIERFVGIPVIAELPHDRRAAAVASGAQRSRRRLARSKLASGARGLAAALVDRTGSGDVDPSRSLTAGPHAGPPSSGRVASGRLGAVR